jgi:hypothetical protein
MHDYVYEKNENLRCTPTTETYPEDVEGPGFGGECGLAEGFGGECGLAEGFGGESGLTGSPAAESVAGGPLASGSGAAEVMILSSPDPEARRTPVVGGVSA